MKIKAQPTPQAAAPRKPPAKAAAGNAPAAAKGWQPNRTLQASRQALTGLATAAVTKTIASAPNGPVTGKHPLLERFGEALGMGLGVIVTEALAAVPSWNKPVLDAQGKPVKQVEGATRVGNHDILKRHEEVVGPKISALVAKLPPGALHELLEGLGKGATEAPGESYRLEAAAADALKKL